MNIANLVQLAERFGAQQLSAMTTLDEFVSEAGRGMSWADQCLQFESALDGWGDYVGERCFHDAARDLFIAKARLAFYGAMAPTGKARIWSFAAIEAQQLLQDAMQDEAA